MARTNQTGSIVGFIVIGAVLIVGSAGLLYWVSHRDTSSPNPPEVSIPAATEKKKDESSDTPKPETSTDTTKENTDSAETNQAQAQTTPAVDQIPQTGPADTFVQLIAISLLGGTIVAFIRSRYHRSTL